MPDIIQRLKDAYSENPVKALELLPELFQLADDGKIVVLPCKDFYTSQGNTVYLIDDGEIVEVMNLGVDICPNGKISCTLCADDAIFPYREPDAEHDDFADWCKETIEVKPEDFSKTVFLTREAAENALEGRK